MDISHSALAALEAISAKFDSSISLSDYIVALLEYPSLQKHQCTLNLIQNTDKILQAFACHSSSKDHVFAWASTTMKEMYSKSIKLLVSGEEWQFNLSKTSAKELEGFRIEDMAADMKTLAPELWMLLDLLLLGDWRQSRKEDADVVMGDPKALDTEIEDVDELPRCSGSTTQARHEALNTIVHFRRPYQYTINSNVIY